MAEKEQDPVAWMVKFCEPCPSQEANFSELMMSTSEYDYTAQFSSSESDSDDHCSSSESDSDDQFSSSESEYMISPPGSPSSDNQSDDEDAVIVTPPEHCSVEQIAWEA